MNRPGEADRSVLEGLDAHTVFLWSLAPAPHSRWLLALGPVIWAGIPLLLLWLLLRLAAWSAVAAAGVAAALTLFGLGRYLAARLRWLFARHDPRSRASALAAPQALLLTLVGWLHLMASPVVGLRSGFDGASTELGEFAPWLMLAASKVVDLLLFDLSDPLGWQLGPLHVAAPRAALATAVLQVLLAAGLLEMAVRVWRMLSGVERFYGTLGECRARCADHLDLEARITLEGVVREQGPIREVSTADLQSAFAADAKREELRLEPRDEREEL